MRSPALAKINILGRAHGHHIAVPHKIIHMQTYLPLGADLYWFGCVGLVREEKLFLYHLGSGLLNYNYKS